MLCASSNNYIEPVGDLEQEVWDHCEEKSHSIEIVYKNVKSEEEILAQVHFTTNKEVAIGEEVCIENLKIPHWKSLQWKSPHWGALSIAAQMLPGDLWTLAIETFLLVDCEQ